MNNKNQAPISELYGRFHQNRKSLRRIVTTQDFTQILILPIINSIKFNSVLDLGCGSGAISLYLAQHKKKCVGVDLSLNTIRVAHHDAKKFTLAENACFIVTDVQKVGLKHKFDLVLLLEVLEHVNDELTLQNISNLISKGSYVIASSPSINAPLYRMGLLNSFDRRVGHLRRYSPSSFSSLFKKNGFEVERMYLNEGIVRNALFNFNISPAVKLLNRSRSLSMMFTKLDQLMAKLFGESDIVIVARKKQ